MKSTLCTSCDGRGFDWKQGEIISRRDGSSVATTYTQGDDCKACGGSGKCGLGPMSKALWLLLALVVTAFIIQPALHLIFD